MWRAAPLAGRFARAAFASAAAALVVSQAPTAVVAAEWSGRLEGHGGPVKSIVLSRDETRALSASFDYSVILWQRQDQGAGVVHRLIGHDAPVNDARFLPGGRAVSVGDDGAILLWGLGTGQVLDRVDTGAEKLIQVRAAPDGSFVVAASWDHTARVFDLAGDRLIEAARLEGHRGPVNAVAITPDGAGVYTAAYDGGIRLFDRATGGLLREVYRHGWGVNVLALTGDGRRLVFGAADGTLAVLDPLSGEIVKQLASHTRPVLALALSADGRRLAGGGGDGAIRVYVTDDWHLLETYDNPHGPVWGLTLTAQGRRALHVGLDDHVSVWQVNPRVAFDDSGQSAPRRFQVGETGDPGARQFARKCSVCHTLTPADGNRAGPTLHGLFGRRAGSLPGYPYSKALREAGFIWTEETVSDLFARGPDLVTPGSKMPLQRLTDQEERRALVAYLKRATAPKGMSAPGQPQAGQAKDERR